MSDDPFLEDVYIRIRKTLTRYLRSHPEWEDAVQEGCIRAWKDFEEGKRDSVYMVNRGVTWGKAYLQSDRGGGRRATGRPVSSSDGYHTADGIASRQKMKQYVEQFYPLHNRKPKPTEAAKALGISGEYASVLLKTYEQGLYATKVGNRDTWELTVGMDTMRLQSSETDEASKVFVRSTMIPSFEDEVLSNDFMETIISQLKERHGQVIRMYFMLGFTPKEIGEYYNYPKWPVQNGVKNINAALKAVKKVLDASTD